MVQGNLPRDPHSLLASAKCERAITVFAPPLPSLRNILNATAGRVSNGRILRWNKKKTNNPPARPDWDLIHTLHRIRPTEASGNSARKHPQDEGCSR